MTNSLIMCQFTRIVLIVQTCRFELEPFSDEPNLIFTQSSHKTSLRWRKLKSMETELENEKLEQSPSLQGFAYISAHPNFLGVRMGRYVHIRTFLSTLSAHQRALYKCIQGLLISIEVVLGVSHFLSSASCT